MEMSIRSQKYNPSPFFTNFYNVKSSILKLKISFLCNKAQMEFQRKNLLLLNLLRRKMELKSTPIKIKI